MGKRGVFLAAFLAMLLAVASSVKTDDDKVAKVIGVASCSDCTDKNVNSFKGLHVAVVCESESKYFEPEGLSEMTMDGKFDMEIRSSLLKEDGSGLNKQCYAQLYSSAKDTPCLTDQSQSDNFKLVFSGKDKGVYVFGLAGGKLSFSQATCGEKTFWPHPTFKLPPLHPWKKYFPKFPCPKPTPPSSPRPNPPRPKPPKPTPPTYTPKPMPPTPKPPKPTPPTYTPKPMPPTPKPPKPTPPTYTPKPMPPTPKPPKPTPPTYTPKPMPPTPKPPKPTPPTYTPKPPKPTPPTYTPKPNPPTHKPPKPTPPTYTPEPTPPTYTPKPTPPVSKSPPMTPICPPKPKFPWHHHPGFPPSTDQPH